MANQKKFILTLIKFGVSGALIYWILQGTNLTEIWQIINSANLLLLVVAFSLKFVGFYVSALRWRVLLKAQGINAALPFLIKSYLVGSFFSNLLPSIIGGDAVRVYDSWRIGAGKAGALAVIVVDRFMGILALMLFALGAMFFSPNLTARLPSPFLYLCTVMILFSVILVISMIFLPPQKISALVNKIRFPFSGKLQAILDKITNAFMVFQGQKKALISALWLSVLLQTNVVIYYYLIAKSLDFPISFYHFFLIVPVALLIMMAPVSINAIGIRENVFAFLFLPFGVVKIEAVAFSWVAYALLIVQGLIGGIVYAFRKNITPQ